MKVEEISRQRDQQGQIPCGWKEGAGCMLGLGCWGFTNPGGEQEGERKEMRFERSGQAMKAV